MAGLSREMDTVCQFSRELEWLSEGKPNDAHRSVTGCDRIGHFSHLFAGCWFGITCYGHKTWRVSMQTFVYTEVVHFGRCIQYCVEHIFYLHGWRSTESSYMRSLVLDQLHIHRLFYTLRPIIIPGGKYHVIRHPCVWKCSSLSFSKNASVCWRIRQMFKA